MKKMMQRDSTWAGIFLLPNLICFLLFVLIPIVSAFALSFMQWDMLSTPKFIGFDNYIRLFTQDEIFIQVLVNTLIFTACSVPIVIIASMLIAMALNQQIFGKKLYRVLIFLPVISSNVVVSVMWKWLLVPDYGFVNYFLSWFGIAGPNWLTDANWSMFSIITGTMTKLRKNEEVALSVLLRICDYLDCNIGDICDAVRQEKY